MPTSTQIAKVFLDACSACNEDPIKSWDGSFQYHAKVYAAIALWTAFPEYPRNRVDEWLKSKYGLSAATKRHIKNLPSWMEANVYNKYYNANLLTEGRHKPTTKDIGPTGDEVFTALLEILSEDAIKVKLVESGIKIVPNNQKILVQLKPSKIRYHLKKPHLMGSALVKAHTIIQDRKKERKSEMV